MKNNWSAGFIFKGMVVFGMLVEAIRDGMVILLPVQKQAALQVLNGRWIWNPFDTVLWSSGLVGFVADGIGAGMCLVLVIALFADARTLIPGSGKQSRIGIVVGVAVASLLMPGITLFQITLFAMGVSLIFGVALSINLIGYAHLFVSFGVILGITMWIFFLYGGVVTIVAMVTLVMVNFICIIFGFFIGYVANVLKNRISDMGAPAEH